MISREFLKSAEFFAPLADEEASGMLALAQEKVFRKGDVVFSAGDPADRLYLVLSGVLEVTRTVPGAVRPVRMGRVERGGILGEMELFDRGPRPATATAVVVPETRLAVWDYSDLHEFLGGQPEAGVKVMRALLARMASRVRDASEALQLLLRAVGRE